MLLAKGGPRIALTSEVLLSTHFCQMLASCLMSDCPLQAPDCVSLQVFYVSENFNIFMKCLRSPDLFVAASCQYMTRAAK